MKFCSQCGKTISILDQSRSEFCSTCAEKLTLQKTNQAERVKSSDILSARLSHKEGKFILESKEGWLLWSGSDNDTHSLRTMLERAERILNIRKRQTK